MGSPLGGQRFLVLVTGHAAAGKTTLAPRIAEGIDALWLSRDRIHEMVYSGWQPRHPALSSTSGYDPRVDGSTFHEGRVTWDLFLWMLQRVTTRTAVVADTPFNHEWNREMFASAAADIRVPMVEVALTGDPEVLRARAIRRATSGQVHEIKARFSVNPQHYYERPHRPVLPESRVLRVDSTDLDSVDIAAIVGGICSILAS